MKVDTSDEGKKCRGSNTQQLLLLTIPGLSIALLCYGTQVVHLLLLGGISYTLLLLVPPQWIHLTTLVVAMSHLSLLHIDRLVNDYSIYTIDITAYVSQVCMF